MDTKISDIPVIQRSKPTPDASPVLPVSTCCTPKNDAAVCCTPNPTDEADNGACCAQPDDGSSCCDK